MLKRSIGWLVCLPAVVAMSASASTLWAQGETPAAPPPAAAPPEAAPAAEATPTAEPVLQFNFKDAPYSEVVNFFSRAVGLPVIARVDPPPGALTYFSPESYTYSEALRILNIILQTKGVTLTREGEFLYLGTFDKTNPGPTYLAGTIPGDVTPEQLITVLIRLENITANELSERLKSLVGAYGGITPLPQQNALLVTETAGQIRRLQTIVEALDSAGDYQDQVRIFPVEHAQATALVNTLKVLMSERVVKYVINQQGQQVKLEEDDLAGLRIEPDSRTNTIIAKGPIGRLDTLKEMIAMLDVPGRQGADGTDMTTISLGRISSAEASRLLNDLFRPLKNEDKPVILPLDELNRITIVGSAVALDRAVELLEEVDGGGEDPLNFARTATVVPLRYAAPASVQQALRALMTPRQTRLVNTLPSPDGRSLILAGPTGDVEQVRSLTQTLDVEPRDRPREVRLIRLARGDAEAVLKRVGELYERETGGPEADPMRVIEVERDPESNAITLIGRREAIDRWQALLTSVESALPIEKETRQAAVSPGQAARIAGPLRTLAQQMLTPADGSPFVAPEITPVEALDVILLTALPEQMPVLESIVKALDDRRARDVQFRVVNIAGADAESVVARAAEIYAQQRQADAALTEVSVDHDAAAGVLYLVAEAPAMARYSAILTQLQQTVGAAREARLVALQFVDAGKAASFLGDLVSASKSFQGGAIGPAPIVEVIEATNSLLVAAQPAQHQIIQAILREFDQPRHSDETVELRVFNLVQAKAASIVPAIQSLLAAKGAAPGARAASVTAEESTNSVVVAAATDQMREIELLIDRLDAGQAADQPQVRTVFLRNARAERVAPMVEQLLRGEQMDQWMRFDFMRRGWQLPDLGPDVRVASEPRLNAVIVSAPASVLNLAEEMVRQLDVDPSQTASASRRSIRVMPLLNATAQDVAAGLEAVLADDAGAAADPPVIRVDAGSNCLIIRATAEQFTLIEQIVSELEAATMTASREVRMIPVDRSRASAAQTAETLRRLLEQRGGTRVEIISVDELIRRQKEAEGESSAEDERDEGEEAQGAAPAASKAMAPAVAEAKTPAASALSDASMPECFDPSMPRRLDALMPLFVSLCLCGEIDFIAPPEEEPDIIIAVDEATNSLIIVGSPAANRRLAQLAEQIQSQIPGLPEHIRYLALDERANANQVATVVNNMVNQMRRRGAAGGLTGEVAVIADQQGSGLIVSANDVDFEVIGRVITAMNRFTPMEDAPPLTMIETVSAAPSRLKTILEQVLIGGDPARRERITLVPDDPSQLLLVRANEDDLAAIREVVKEVDRFETKELPIRAIKLERADAQRAAQSLQQFFEDRARLTQRPGQPRPPRRISVVGDQRSSTVFIAANDADFGEIEHLLRAFDAPSEAQDLKYEIIPLKFAKAEDVSQIVNSMGWQLTYDQGVGPWGGRSEVRGKISVQADARTNSLIVSGTGENFDLIKSVAVALDAPADLQAARSVRILRIEHGDVNIINRAVQETYGAAQMPTWWWYEPADPDEVKIISDVANKLLIVSGRESDLDGIAGFVKTLDEASQRPGQAIEILTVNHARASDVAQSLVRFFNDRARAANLPSPGITMTPADESGRIVVSATAEQIATIRDLLSSIDVPSAGDDRDFRLHALEHGSAENAMQTLRELFPARGETAARQVLVTADARTNSLVVSAPRDRFGEIDAVLGMIDAPPAGSVKLIQTFSLANARAAEVAQVLSEAFDLTRQPGRARSRTIQEEVTRFMLDGTDEGAAPIEIDARITTNARNNSLIVVATPESMPMIARFVSELDEAPIRSVREYRIYPLTHIVAADVRYTLTSLLTQRADRPGGATADPAPTVSTSPRDNSLIIAATAEQHTEIEQVLRQIDLPAKTVRTTEFVPLKFAQAEKVAGALDVFYGRYALEADTPSKQNVSIVPDPASNSLVISAEESEWPGIRELIAKLDGEEYDTTLQLEVIALRYADASSVSTAINQAFAPQVEPRRGGNQPVRRPGNGEGQPEDGGAQPRILVADTDVVRAAAEPLTNSIIVSASRRNLEKIRAIVESLDVADYAQLPPVRLIPLDEAKAAEVAATLTSMYADESGRGGARRSGRKSVLISADAASNTVIVRAEEEEFSQIEALARALEQTSRKEGMTVRVLSLAKASAPRVAEAIRETFAATARTMDEPLAIEVDSVANSLIVASSARLFEQIVGVVEELDRLGPGGGQQIFVVPIENVAPEEMKRILESLDLDKQREGAAGILGEPLKVTVLPGRRALAVVGNPGDRERILAIIGALDAAPDLAQAQVRLVELRQAEAGAVADILRELLRPAEQHAQTPLATAIREQVRRLSLHRSGALEDDIELDLTQPIRVVPAPNVNAILISSTPANCEALEEIARLFDRLPVTEAVTVRLFPLSNIAASMMKSIAEDLFTQGRKLATQPGTNIEGRPLTEVGGALIEDVAMTVDERTNTLIVAGREAAVALVEVLIGKLDSDIAARWVEPRVLLLRHADAEDLAEVLDEVLVRGQATGPEAQSMQRQVGRLRIARRGGGPEDMLDADLFVPMTRLLIRPEPKLNALVVVGTPENIAVVGELVAMLDVPAAAPSQAVRIYTLNHATAARVAGILVNLFDRQAQTGAIRDEDRVVAQPDERTNSLIVTTSPRSFSVLEMLLQSLDSRRAAEMHDIRMIRLDNASATVIAPLIQRLMDSRLERLRRYEPETADLQQATIIADPRTNSLLITAGAESFAVIEQLANSLENTRASAANDVQIIPLERGNAAKVADTIQRVMDRQYADLPADLASREKPLILTDSRTNSLLVTASADDLKRIGDLVTKLENAPFNPALSLHVIPVTGQRVETLAPRLTSLMRERERSLGESAGVQDRTVIEADPATNSLIVAASEDNLNIVRGLIETLSDAETFAATGAQVEIITLRNSLADRMVDQLNALYVTEANRTRGAGTIRVSADTRLNAVAISAPEHDLAALRNLINELESTQVTDVREIQMIPLKAANAIEIVSVLENVLSGGRRGGATEGQATIIRFIRESARDLIEKERRQPGEPTETEISLAVREAIRFTPDLRTNSVVVSAPASSMRMIRELIDELDSSETGSKRVRIFELVNADAVQMAELLGELFNLREQGLILRPRDDGAGGVTPPDPSVVATFNDTELVTATDERQQLSMTVDPRTNSLIVSGTPRYLDLVEQVIKDLDSKTGTRREEKVYALRNARATDVATALNDFLTQEQERILRTLGPDRAGSILQQLEREVSVVGVTESNTLMISASPRYMDKIQGIIEELDKTPPQVLISVMLAEVTLDSDEQWGMDITVGPFRGDRVTASSSFGLAAATLSGLGVPNLSVSTDDLELLIRALEAQGRLEVLSRPQILVNNNVNATFQVGQNIGIVEDVNVSDTGTARSTVGRKDIGIILDVLPSISPDRFVRMEVKPEISSLSARTTQVSEDFQAPIIDTRTVDTVVTVKDGQTVVIGGLFSTRTEMRNQKVPFFGDIPILGIPFRTKLHRREKTEFLVVITPHVVGSIEDAKKYTDEAIIDLTLPETTKDQIRSGRIVPSLWTDPTDKDKNKARKEEEER
ncbi:MAG: hypothetical protein KJZ69_04355 [Phycisphaerales bacterium]|nr:hypothetical protein [Phycisphaerales bacterium]